MKEQEGKPSCKMGNESGNSSHIAVGAFPLLETPTYLPMRRRNSAVGTTMPQTPSSPVS
jgi:hypothetical protein